MFAFAQKALEAAVAFARGLVWSRAVEGVFGTDVRSSADVALNGVLGEGARRGIGVVSYFVTTSTLGDGRVVSCGNKADLRVEHINAPTFRRFSLSPSLVNVGHRDGRGGVVSYVRRVGLPVGGSAEYRMGEGRITADFT